MITVDERGNIGYTKDDTFKIMVTQEYEGLFEPGMQLRLVIAPSEESEYIINKTFNINNELYFDLSLTDNEKASLDIGEYLYKMTLLKNNTVVTRMSGYLNVKWGA